VQCSTIHAGWQHSSKTICYYEAVKVYICISRYKNLNYCQQEVNSGWQHCMINPAFEIFSISWHALYSDVNVSPSWPIMYKPRCMEGLSVEIRAINGNCQIFYCNFSGLSTSIIPEFMPFFIYQALRNLLHIWHCNIIEPSTS